MKRKLLSAGIFVLLIMFVIGVTAFTSKADEVTITGTVVVLERDDNDNVIAVSIETDDGTFYDVIDDAIGKKLFELIDKSVKVTGVIGEGEDDYGTITVKKYEILND